MLVIYIVNGFDHGWDLADFFFHKKIVNSDSIAICGAVDSSKSQVVISLNFHLILVSIST